MLFPGSRDGHSNLNRLEIQKQEFHLLQYWGKEVETVRRVVLAVQDNSWDTRMQPWHRPSELMDCHHQD